MRACLMRWPRGSDRLRQSERAAGYFDAGTWLDERFSLGLTHTLLSSSGSTGRSSKH